LNKKKIKTISQIIKNRSFEKQPQPPPSTKMFKFVSLTHFRPFSSKILYTSPRLFSKCTPTSTSQKIPQKITRSPHLHHFPLIPHPILATAPQKHSFYPQTNPFTSIYRCSSSKPQQPEIPLDSQVIPPPRTNRSARKRTPVTREDKKNYVKIALVTAILSFCFLDLDFDNGSIAIGNMIPYQDLYKISLGLRLFLLKKYDINLIKDHEIDLIDKSPEGPHLFQTVGFRTAGSEPDQQISLETGSQ